MPLKVTFFYNQYKQGFSETYYLNTNNPALATTNMSSQLLGAMTQFRSNATLLYAIRATQVATPFQSYTRLIRGAFQGAAVAEPDAGPDVVSSTAVLQIVSENATKRRLFLRGLPDEYVKRDAFGNDLFTGAFKSGCEKMIKSLINGAFAIRKQVAPPDGGLSASRVLSTKKADDDAHQTEIFYVAVGGFNPVVPGKVVFKGIDTRRFPGLNRVQTVMSVGSEAGFPFFKINYSLPGGVLQFPPNMSVTNLQFAYDPITEFTFERFSSHKTGRPFGQLAGRSRRGS